MANEIRHNFTEEQKYQILVAWHCMHEAYRDTIREYVEKGKAIIEKDQFGRLVCTILPEKA